MTLILILFLLSLGEATAKLPCNISFFKGAELEVESMGLCNYLNYHVFMLIFGIFSFVLCVVRAFTQIIFHCGNLEEAKRSFQYGLAFLVLAAGLEASLVALALLLLYISLQEPIMAYTRSAGIFVASIRASVGVVVTKCLRPKPSRVAPLEEVVVVEIGDGDPATLAEDARYCAICMDSSGDLDEWLITRCKHPFHIACIAPWNKNSCPMCRNAAFI